MTNDTHEDEEYIVAPAAELPDPATFNGHMLYRYGRAFQRAQREDGTWTWVELVSPAPPETPAKLP